MENESEIIKLPSRLGSIVSKILKEEHDIEPRENGDGSLDCSFTEDEIYLIKSLKIINPLPHDLEGIHLLENLRKLEIETKLDTDEHQQNVLHSITDQDVEDISKCTFLKNLSIINQSRINSIDVSNLKRLKSLTISNNESLEKVEGMEQLKELKDIECYGNDNLFNIDELDTVFLQNEDLEKASFDAIIFPDVVENNFNIGKANVTWKERVDKNKYINMNTSEMEQVHSKALKTLSRIREASSKNIEDTENTILSIEQYLAKNVQYVYEKDEDFEGEHDGMYNALVNDNCDSGEYKRVMQYLLKLQGIRSHITDQYVCVDDYNSLCIDPGDIAYRYQQGDKSIYNKFDSFEMNKDFNKDFFKKINKDKTMVEIENPVQESIQKNRIFMELKTRVGKINNTRRNIEDQIKGITKEKEGQDI